ncbi:MAG TPA: hypothetical protein VF433_04260 [Cellvibrio sp.]|jgi:hypothetical protein
MIQCDFFGKHIELVIKAARTARQSFRRIRAVCPFQLDLFIKRIPVGMSALPHLKTGTRLTAAKTGLRVAFKFIKKGLFVFEFDHHFFSISATDAALLEF